MVMNTTLGSTEQDHSKVPINDANPANYYFGRWVSEPLNMSSISANTWTYNFFAAEANAGFNYPVSGTNQPVRVNCYIWRPGTSAKIGTILDGNTASTVNEGGAGAQVTHHVAFSGTGVSSMQAGDVICFEVWFILDPTSTSASTGIFWYYDGSNINTVEGGTSGNASFIETPQTLTFYTPPINMTNTSTKTYSNKFIVKV